jgi:hypothetical protein
MVVAVTGPHCNENLIYVFSEKELFGISFNFYIHVYVSELGSHIFLQQNRQSGRPIVGIYKPLTDT